MNFHIKIGIIYLFINWTRGEAIRGLNVRDPAVGEFPFVVALSEKENEVEPKSPNLLQFCTGSLITRKHVLTAGYCVLNKKVADVEVLVGSINLARCNAYDPENWITWQEWEYGDREKFPSYHHDVAVVTLKQCITENNIKPMKISKLKPTKYVGKKVTMAGWGVTNRNVKPNLLKTSELKVLSYEECRNILFQATLSQTTQRNLSLTDQHLCAKSEPWSLSGCGDSGGPLIYKAKEIIAVTVGDCLDETNVPEDDSGKAVIQLINRKVNVYLSLDQYEVFISSFITENAGNNRCSLMK